MKSSRTGLIIEAAPYLGYGLLPLGYPQPSNERPLRCRTKQEPMALSEDITVSFFFPSSLACVSNPAVTQQRDTSQRVGRGCGCLHIRHLNATVSTRRCAHCGVNHSVGKGKRVVNDGFDGLLAVHSAAGSHEEEASPLKGFGFQKST